jgi:peptide/nickel transport system ATP-binding protein
MSTIMADSATPTTTRASSEASTGANRGTINLRVKDLRVHFRTIGGTVRAVNGVTFALRMGERLGLVGESGSGKSTTAYAIMRQIKPPGTIAGGSIFLGEQDLLALSDEAMRKLRSDAVTLIPQGAMNSLNPVMRIREQILDIYAAHDNPLSADEINEKIGFLLKWVGLKPDVAAMYPHELSGGMKQRVCIAMGIALRPQVIIADEPTSALDVVVQRQVMETLDRVQKDLNASLILVGHDMGLMAQFVDRVGVMYAGRLVEVGAVRDIFQRPQHPYTKMLISSIPNLETKGAFKGIPGVAPSLLDPPTGCPFHPRCPSVMEHCKTLMPELAPVLPDHEVSCHLYEVQPAAVPVSATRGETTA